MFNGQPQFRIKRRQDSAKNQKNREEIIKKAKCSSNYIETNVNDTATDQWTEEDYLGDKMTRLRNRLTDLSNNNIISKLPSKYGLGILPSSSKTRKSSKDMHQNGTLKKTFSNSHSTLQSSDNNFAPPRPKISKGSFKKKFTDHNRLPDINQNNTVLPKIK